MSGGDFWRWAERFALILAILGGIGLLAFFKFIWAWLKRGAQILHRAASSAPRDCLRIVPFPDRDYWWHQGTSGGKPAMQIGGRWHVTNVEEVPVRLFRARIVRPSVDAFLLIQEPNGAIPGDYPILPGRTSTVHVHTFIEPMPCEAGEDFRADLVLTDQFGNDYRLRKVVFRCDEPTKAKAAKNKAKESVPREDTSADGEASRPSAE